MPDEMPERPRPADLFRPDPESELRRLVDRMRGRRLPGERELALSLGVSRPRLRSLLASLQAEGLVHSRQGSGTYAVAHAGASRDDLRTVAVLADRGLKLGEDPFFGHLLERLQAALQAAGVGCLVARVDADAPRDATPPAADGLLTIGLSGTAILASHRSNADPPLVTLLLGPEARPGRRASVFRLADAEAGADAARHLLAAGCRTLVYAGRDDLPAGRERHEGAEAAARVAGASLRLLPAGLNYAGGLAAAPSLAALLAETPESAGVIAANDWMAAGLRAGLRALGPAADVPMVSFDGLPIAADPSLGITSLTVPVGDIAADAVAELRRLRASPDAIGRAVIYPLG